ncbi:hypothetical protein ACVWYN_003559 [Pedobacter sp. UYP24]
MKKISLLSILILTVCTLFSVNAFAQKAKDSTKYTFISIDGKGGIHDHAGTKLGYITKDDIVKNNNGKTLYFIDKNGNVIDAKGNKLGMAKKNGDYINNDGITVLQLKNADEEKCAIFDPAGHSWGNIHKNYKLHSCAAHCFFLQQVKDKAAKAN